MRTKTVAYAVGTLMIGGLIAAQSAFAANKDEVRRGAYLVNFGGCFDCHAPKMMTDKGPVPDPAKGLSGHQANTKVPPMPAGVIGPNLWAGATNSDFTAWIGPWGTSFAANLTSDKETGIGSWSQDQFVKTIRTGKHLGTGRPILPPMPWFNVALLTDGDLKAVYAYLMSTKPIKNQVPAPIPPKGP